MNISLLEKGVRRWRTWLMDSRWSNGDASTVVGIGADASLSDIESSSFIKFCSLSSQSHGRRSRSSDSWPQNASKSVYSLKSSVDTSTLRCEKRIARGNQSRSSVNFFDYKENIFDIGYTEMGPYYRIITSASSLLPLDQSLLDSMEKDNAEELKKLDNRLEEAEKIEGESEISDALKARANYLTRIGDKVPISLLVWGISNGSKPSIGSGSWSSKPRPREDTWPWITNRYRSNHRTDRFLL